MVVHDNIHIPQESWPNWIWYVLEFGIVLAISMIIGWKASDYMLYNVADVLGYGNALDSWVGISVNSPDFKALDNIIEGKIVSMSNWIFYGIVGSIFGTWYIIIRGFILKKKIFK